MPISLSQLNADGVKRCWGGAFSSAAQRAYHDESWGRALPPGSGRSLYCQLVLQTFQSGLSWSTILGKARNFEARFEGYDYHRVATWGASEVAAALADAGIVRNAAKVRAAVSNAAAAVQLDIAAPGGFEGFVWRTCGQLPSGERVLQMDSRSGTHMRASTKDDYVSADGVHPTVGVVAAVQAFKRAGFKFLGPAVMLSFMQAAGFCNHHKPDCSAFQLAEAAYAASAATLAARLPLSAAAARIGDGRQIMRAAGTRRATSTAVAEDARCVSASLAAEIPRVISGKKRRRPSPAAGERSARTGI